MNSPVSACYSTKKIKKDAKVVRPLANFPPNIWGDILSNFTPPDEVVQKQEEQEVRLLKEKVRKELLIPIEKDPKESLFLLDAIERLGVAYHFEEEIEANLQEFLGNSFGICYENDLEYDSLRFRLLRQNGFYISCDVFDKFKDENGNFMDYIKTDVEGILSLYEASHLRVHDETVLDEALAFATAELTSLASTLSSPFAQQITHALKRPLYSTATRLGAKYQIRVYESHISHNEDLLKLAKIDFNLLQLLHKKELSDLIRWSRTQDFAGKFPFAREREVEMAYWTLGVFYEPKYSYARGILNKFGCIMTVMDDIYDSYGTIEELELFTNALIGWNKSCLRQLPECMKFMYQIVFDTFQELEQDLAKEGRSYAIQCLLNEFRVNCQAYLQEVRWCNEKYIPSYNEYIKNALGSCTFAIMVNATYQGMGEIASKEGLEWINRNSNALKAACTFARIMNDMAGHKIQKTRDHVASTVDCYMSSFNLSEEEAYKELEKEMVEQWKDIRVEMFRPTAPTIVPMPLLMAILNASKALYDLYEIGIEGFTIGEHIRLKVKSIFVDTII